MGGATLRFARFCGLLRTGGDNFFALGVTFGYGFASIYWGGVGSGKGERGRLWLGRDGVVLLLGGMFCWGDV